MSKDETNEVKIKEAARNIFVKKGFAATRMRDIAKEADTNLALVNYYFRSKELLFRQIMLESLSVFFTSVRTVFNEENTSLEEKIQLLVSGYINQLKAQPDIPMFILNELRSNQDEFVGFMANNFKIKESIFFRQLQSSTSPERLVKINPVHIIINIMSLTLFPFVAQPMLRHVAEIDDTLFDSLMDQRKQLIPIWVKQMME